MTPKRKDLTPQKVLNWLLSIKKEVGRRDRDSATTYQIKSMFGYIEDLIKYQIPTTPIDVSEDGHKFTCPRCKTQFDTEDSVEDFNLCYICGQRWKEEGHE